MVEENFTFRIGTDFDPGNSSSQADKLAKSFDEIGSEAAEAAKGTEDLNESLGSTMKNAERAAKGIDDVSESSKRSSKLLGVNIAAISSLSQNLNNIANAAKLVAGIFGNLAGGVGSLINQFEEAGADLGVLSAAMNGVRQSTNATSQDIDNLTNFISELSAQSAISEGEIGKVIARFTAFGLSQREAADAAIQTINVVRDSGREIDEVATAFVDSFKGSAEGLQQLGIGVQNLTMQELLRGDAVREVSELYGEQLTPIKRVDEFIAEIRAKWDLLRKAVVNAVAESKALQGILDGVSQVLTIAIGNVPGFGELIDAAIKNAIAGAVDLRATFIDIRTDVINTTLEIAALGAAIKSVSQFATGRFIGGAISATGAVLAGGSRVTGGDESAAASENLRSLADDIRDGTKPLEELVTDLLGETGEGNADALNSLKDLLGENKNQSSQQKAAAEAAADAAKAQRETEEQIIKTAAEARLSLKENIQTLAASNEDAIKSLNESELSGEIQVTSPELDLINDVVASLQSGNEVRVADFEALRELAIQTGQIGENERLSAQELVMRMGTVREGILEQVEIQQRGFKEETRRYQEQRKILISQRDTAAKSFAAMVKSLDLQRITFQKRAEQEGKDFSRQIEAIEAQKATAEAGFNNLTSGIDRGIAELDAEFSETRSQYQSISQREVTNVIDIARRAAMQRDQQIAATQETAAAAKEAAKASEGTRKEQEKTEVTLRNWFEIIRHNITHFATQYNEGHLSKEDLLFVVGSNRYGIKNRQQILREAARLRAVNERILRVTERQAIRDEQVRAEERAKASAEAARRPSSSTPSRSNQIGDTVVVTRISNLEAEIGRLERALGPYPDDRTFVNTPRSEIRSEIARLQKELAAEIKKEADAAAAEREAARRRAEASVNRIGGGVPGVSSEEAARIAAEMAAEEARRRADEIAEQASKDAERLQASFDRQRERIEGEIEAARDRLEFLRGQVDALREEVDITREIGERRVELAQAFLDTEQAFLDEQRAQNLSARNAFNPFRDLDRQEERSIPLNVSIQLGDQRLADVLLNLQESGYGNILRAA